MTAKLTVEISSTTKANRTVSVDMYFFDTHVARKFASLIRAGAHTFANDTKTVVLIPDMPEEVETPSKNVIEIHYNADRALRKVLLFCAELSSL